MQVFKQYLNRDLESLVDIIEPTSFCCCMNFFSSWFGDDREFGAGSSTMGHTDLCESPPSDMRQRLISHDPLTDQETECGEEDRQDDDEEDMTEREMHSKVHFGIESSPWQMTNGFSESFSDSDSDEDVDESYKPVHDKDDRIRHGHPKSHLHFGIERPPWQMTNDFDESDSDSDEDEYGKPMNVRDTERENRQVDNYSTSPLVVNKTSQMEEDDQNLKIFNHKPTALSSAHMKFVQTSRWEKVDVIDSEKYECFSDDDGECSVSSDISAQSL